MAVENSKLLLNDDGSPKDRIVGFETEYGAHCRVGELPSNFKEPLFSVLSPQAQLEMFEDKLTCLIVEQHHSISQYDSDGDRQYVDVGPHPELSTAEEVSFLGAAHRLVRGHRKVADFYSHVVECFQEEQPEMPMVTFNLLANTCDPQGNSWASHQNMLARRQLEPYDYIDAFVAHNDSKVVWSGAGHTQPTASSSYRFVLSEKADHIWAIANVETTRNRPLVNLRDKPLADAAKYRRIHDVSGETVFSPFVNALRLASASIILRACELGVAFDDLMPENPVGAIREVSGDPTLKKKISLLNGRQKYTGVELQQKIAERAIGCAKQADYLTEQESLWAERWLQLLEDLSIDPVRCLRQIDWLVKQQMVERAIAENAAQTVPLNVGAVALATSMNYHRLLPIEGRGMKLLRKGFFEDSPTPVVLEEGLALPETRAKLRGPAVKTLAAIADERGLTWLDRPFTAHWQGIQTSMPRHYRVFKLNEPYATEDEKLSLFIERLAA